MKPEKLHIVKEAIAVDGGSMLELVTIDYDTAKSINPEIKRYISRKEASEESRRFMAQMKEYEYDGAYATPLGLTAALQETDPILLNAYENSITTRLSKTPGAEFSKWYVPGREINQFQMLKKIPDQAKMVPGIFDFNLR